MMNPSYQRFCFACDAIVSSYDDRNYGRSCLVGHLMALLDINCSEEQLQEICEKLERQLVPETA